jgi:pyridoxal phosphate enzyme (YggS family)
MFNYKKYQEIQGFIRKHQKISKIVAISKNHPKESVIEALKHGVRIFGENRVQEAKIKFVELFKEYPNLELHFTGSLQTNKVKSALQIFQVFQTIDREKLANEFQKFPNLTKDKKFLIQVNTGKESSKSGVMPNEAKDFIRYCVNELKLNVIGLMCMPPIAESPKLHFALLQKIAIENNINQLSMGMSNDYVEAVMLNATYIRLGTILFGKRK